MKSCLTLSLFLFCAFLALVGGAIFIHEYNPVTQQQRAAELAYRQARDAQDLAERQEKAERDAQFWRDVQPFVTVAVVLVILLIPVALGGLGAGAWYAVRRRGALVHVAPNVPPLPFDGVVTGQYGQLTALGLAGHFEVEKTRAANPVPVIPTSVTRYTDARRFTYDGPPPRVIGSPEPPALAAPPVAVPTFADLLSLGQVGRDGRLLLGYADGEPVHGQGFKSLFSFGIAGLQGSGKTTTARFLNAQAVMMGAQLAIIDPHRDTGDESLAAALAPLHGAFLADPAASDEEIRRVLRLVNALIDRREAGERGPVVILAIDEWTDLQRRRVAQDLAETARRTATVGRKLGIFCEISGQGWTKEAAGEVRDYLTAAYVHKLRPAIARLLAPNCPANVWELAPGQAYLDQTTGGRRLVTVPQTTAQDLAAVAGLLPRRSGGNDSASWASRPPPPPRQSTYPPAWMPPDDVPPVVGRTDGRTDADSTQKEAETGENRPIDRPTVRPSAPGLVEKARAAGMPLDENDWAALAELDTGETVQAIAQRQTASPEASGRPYRRRRDEVQRLRDLVEGWPPGETWETGEGDE